MRLDFHLKRQAFLMIYSTFVTLQTASHQYDYFSIASCDHSKSMKTLWFMASLYRLALLCWRWFKIILSTDLPELFFCHNTLLFTITLGQWIFSQGCWASRFTIYCYCAGSGNTQKPSQNEQQMWTLSCAKW